MTGIRRKHQEQMGEVGMNQQVKALEEYALEEELSQEMGDFFQITLCYIFKEIRDFPGGPVVKNPPYSTGDAGSIPGRGTKIPHATGQLSLRTTTTELVCLN